MMRQTLAVLSLVSVIVLGAGLDLRAQATVGRAIKVKVTAEQANLREKPDIGSGIVQQLPEGTVLDADRKEGEWFFVRYTLEDGGVIGGYIHESLVEVLSQAPPAAQPGRTAARQPAREARSTRTGTPRSAVRGLVSYRLELSVSGGAAWAAPRDLNDSAQGFADTNAALLDIPASGPVNTLHLAAVLGVDLSYRVSPWLSVGAGVDYLRGSNPGRVTYANELLSERLLTRPAVSAIPVKLNLRFYPGRGFYVRGSAGLYFLRAGYLYRTARADAWEQWKGRATSQSFGAEAAFGGDWKVGRKTVFFIEAGFRMARAGGLTGRGVASSSAGEDVVEEGPLYHFREQAADARSYPLLFVRADRPSGEGISDVRRADINISGTAIRAGLRFLF